MDKITGLLKKPNLAFGEFIDLLHFLWINTARCFQINIERKIFKEQWCNCFHTEASWTVILLIICEEYYCPFSLLVARETKIGLKLEVCFLRLVYPLKPFCKLSWKVTFLRWKIVTWTLLLIKLLMAGKFEHKFKLLLGVTVLVAHKNFQCCELYYYVYYFYMCLMKIITVKVYMAVFFRRFGCHKSTTDVCRFHELMACCAVMCIQPC